jgi:hypothetical protein
MLGLSAPCVAGHAPKLTINGTAFTVATVRIVDYTEIDGVLSQHSGLPVNYQTEDCYQLALHFGADGAQGKVCLGSMRVPDEVSVSSLSRWEEAYFASEFTHPSGAVRLTTHPGGFVGLWSSLAGRKRRFPVKFLADCKETLQEFLQRKGER